MKEIATSGLIKNYLPADYLDVFSRTVACKQAISPEEFQALVFKQTPTWVNSLMKLRNAIVKPLGLDTKTQFTQKIHARNENELVFGMPDKHLSFYVSMWCGEYKDGKQELRITTLVKYNHWTGKIYFGLIKAFHRIIIASLLKNIEKQQVQF